MSIQKPICSIIFALTFTSVSLLSGPALFAAEDSMAQYVKDARQEAQIWTTYAMSPYLRDNDIKVFVQHNNAKLSGDVQDEIHKILAEQIALSVEGIKSVNNQIIVKYSYVPSSPSVLSRYSRMIDDATITATIKSKLLCSKHADASTVDVKTQAGKVILRGTANGIEGKEFLGSLATYTRGVMSVDNRMLVNGKSVTSYENSIDDELRTNKSAKQTSDDWITVKVKSTLLYTSNIDSSDVKVSTLDGTVTLSGKLNSVSERVQIIEIAQNIRGVKNVESARLSL